MPGRWCGLRRSIRGRTRRTAAAAIPITRSPGRCSTSGAGSRSSMTLPRPVFGHRLCLLARDSGTAALRLTSTADMRSWDPWVDVPAAGLGRGGRRPRLSIWASARSACSGDHKARTSVRMWRWHGLIWAAALIAGYGRQNSVGRLLRPVAGTRCRGRRTRPGPHGALADKPPAVAPRLGGWLGSVSASARRIAVG
jgi:hypothetical protein